METFKRLFSRTWAPRILVHGAAWVLLGTVLTGTAAALCSARVVDAFFADERAGFATRIGRIGTLLAVSLGLTLVWCFLEHFAERFARSLHARFLFRLKREVLASSAAEALASGGGRRDSLLAACDAAAPVAPDRLLLFARDAAFVIAAVAYLGAANGAIAAVVLVAACGWSALRLRLPIGPSGGASVGDGVPVTTFAAPGAAPRAAFRAELLALAAVTKSDLALSRTAARARLVTAIAVSLACAGYAFVAAAPMVTGRLAAGSAVAGFFFALLCVRSLGNLAAFAARYRAAALAAREVVAALPVSPPAPPVSPAPPEAANTAPPPALPVPPAPEPAAVPSIADPPFAPIPEPATPPALLPDERPDPALPAMAFRFENITVATGEEECPALSRVSFTVEPGTIVALCDPRGSGLAAIERLLAGTCAPSSGRIRIGGVPLDALAPEDRDLFLVFVAGDENLGSRTIGEIVAAGRPGAGDDEIMAAAEAAGVIDFLPYLPQGLATAADSPEAILSPGQRCRVLLARALVGEPAVLAVGDFLGCIDAASRESIMGALEAGRSSRATLILTRDPAFAGRPDRLLYLRDGMLSAT